MSPSSSLAKAVRWPATPLMGPPRVSVLLGRACPLPVAVCLSLPSARLFLPVFLPLSLCSLCFFLPLSLSPSSAFPNLPSHLSLLTQVLGAAVGRLSLASGPSTLGIPLFPVLSPPGAVY